LKANQLELGKVWQKNRASQGDQSSSSGSRSSWSRRTEPEQGHQKVVDAAMAANDDLISELGKQYFLMHELWLDASVFLQPLPARHFDDKDRYRTPENQEAAQILDLYDFVPQRLHFQMATDGKFGKLVHSKIL